MERLIRAAAVLGISLPRHSYGAQRAGFWAVVVMLVLFQSGTIMAAGTLTSASVALGDPRPSQSGVTYTFTGSSVDTATVVRCVKVIWATTLGGDTAPTGFSGASGSVNGGASSLINSSASGWSLAKSDGTSSSGQNNIYQYTNATGVTPASATADTFILTNITNASTADTPYYFRLNTYSNTNCSSGAIDHATVQFINTEASQLSLTVDSSLSFTVSGVNSGTGCAGTSTTSTSTATTIPFGGATTASNRIVCQDLAAATNASGGYTIYLRYTGQLDNGAGGTIADHSGTNASPTTFSSPGTEAYGYTTDDATLGTGTANRFTSGGQKWAAATTSNAEIGYSPVGTSLTHFFIGHQVGISNTTAAGTYQTIIIYTCTPVY